MPALSDMSTEQQHLLRTAASHLAREFEGTFGRPTIEECLASSYDQFAGRATVPNFLPLLAERFARQRLRALAKVEGKATDGTPIVLFLCVHNAGRSQMALGWFNHLAGGRAIAWSGGSEPGAEVNPAAVAAMAEVGIDIRQEYPKPWSQEIVQAADVVITMGCGDACPIFPGKRYEDWTLDDPAGLDVDAVRPIRDELSRRVRTLLAFETAAFDLVSAQYASIPRTPDGRGVRNLADAVAPGGTLLVVGHDLEPLRAPADTPEHTRPFDPDAYLRVDDLATALADAPEWEIEVHEKRPRPAGATSASHHVDDIVLRARHRAASPTPHH